MRTTESILFRLKTPTDICLSKQVTFNTSGWWKSFFKNIKANSQITKAHIFSHSKDCFPSSQVTGRNPKSKKEMLWTGCSFLRCLEMERFFWKPCWTEDLDWDSPTLIKIWHIKVLAKWCLSSQTHCPGPYWELLLLQLWLPLSAVATAIVSKRHIRTTDLDDFTSSENWGNVFLHFSKRNRGAVRSWKNLQSWLEQCKVCNGKRI